MTKDIDSEVEKAIQDIQSAFEYEFQVAKTSQFIRGSYRHWNDSDRPSNIDASGNALEGVIHHFETARANRFFAEDRVAFQKFAATVKKLNRAAKATGEIIGDLYAKTQICKALKSVTGDAFAVSKGLIPVFVTLSATGTITLPLNPLVIAFTSLLIARMGIAAFCKDEKPDPAEKESE